MRRLASAVVLACVLTGTGLAGEIPTSDRKPLHYVAETEEVPTSDRTTQQLASTGEIPDAEVIEMESSATVFRVFLSLFSIVR